MKRIRICLIGISLFFALTIQAQKTENKIKNDSTFIFHAKGRNMVSVLTTGFLTEDAFFEYYGFRYGKFLTNRMLIGGELGRSWFGEWERTTHIGAHYRYYYAVFKHFSYYADAKYLFGYRTYDNSRTASNWNGRTNNFAANAGIAFTGFYKKRFGLEVFAGYAVNMLHIGNHPTLGEYNWSKADIGYGFQINYHF